MAAIEQILDRLGITDEAEREQYREFLSVYQQLTPEQRRKVHDYALHLAEREQTEGGSVKLYSVKEAAQILGVGERTVYRLLQSGELVGRKLGRGWKISADNLKRFTEQPGSQSGTL